MTAAKISEMMYGMAIGVLVVGSACSFLTNTYTLTSVIEVSVYLLILSASTKIVFGANGKELSDAQNVDVDKSTVDSLSKT